MDAADVAIWLCILLPLLIAITESRRRTKLIQKRAKSRRKERSMGMNELIQRCLGKNCILYVGGGWDSNISGVVESIEGNWLSVRTSKTVEVVNLDYISRIREIPEKKK